MATSYFEHIKVRGVAVQYHVSANGVTRYGLSHDAIKSVFVPVPPLSEQSGIIRFLDHFDGHIRRHIRLKHHLIALLSEQKQTIIDRSVTRGIKPDVPLKPSRMNWLDQIPSHWDERRAKFFLREIDGRSADGNEELLSVSHLTGVTPRRDEKHHDVHGRIMGKGSAVPARRSRDKHYVGLDGCLRRIRARWDRQSIIWSLSPEAAGAVPEQIFGLSYSVSAIRRGIQLPF